MHKPQLALWGLVACCLFALPAVAGEGFGFPNLNPFAAKKKPVAQRIADDDLGDAGFPSTGSPVPRESAKRTAPSTLQKMNAGTQSFFAKSKSVLMPWSKSTAPKTPALVTGTTKVYPGSATASKKPPKKSMFGSMFGGEEKKQEPETVTDFIGQPRPPF